MTSERIAVRSILRMSLFGLLAVTALTLFAGRSFAGAPANDNFANAQVLNGLGPANVQANNNDASSEAGEPLYGALNKTVWFRWTAPANLSMTFETQQGGTLADTIMGVFTGSSVNALTRVGDWSDDVTPLINPKSRRTFIATAGTTYYFQVSGFGNSMGAFLFGWSINRAESGKQFNFDGDFAGTSDFAVRRGSNSTWYIRYSPPFSDFLIRQWGNEFDRAVPGDYDGDGKTDIAVWRRSQGTYYILNSNTGTFTAVNWGIDGDEPVQGDFDGDDRADPAVFRSGTFYVLNSTSGFTATAWGQQGDAVACGDYDGDGKTDYGVQRLGGGFGTFYILHSSDGSIFSQQFGFSSDLVYPGDQDGDGKNDLAVYRRSGTYTFYTLRSSDGGLGIVAWGSGSDIPAPGSYGGSPTQSDLCIWRPSEGVFYCYTDGGTGPFLIVPWGTNGDTPIAFSNVH